MERTEQLLTCGDDLFSLLQTKKSSAASHYLSLLTSGTYLILPRHIRISSSTWLAWPAVPTLPLLLLFEDTSTGHMQVGSVLSSNSLDSTRWRVGVGAWQVISFEPSQTVHQNRFRYLWTALARVPRIVDRGDYTNMAIPTECPAGFPIR